jgi:hypothetical protein
VIIIGEWAGFLLFPLLSTVDGAIRVRFEDMEKEREEA